MVTLIIGKKGTGKTKKLITLANEAVEASNGNVVVIEKGSKLTYDVTHKARLIDTEQYSITGYDAFFGFLSGLCAGNYDVTDVLIDSTLKSDETNFGFFALSDSNVRDFHSFLITGKNQKRLYRSIITEGGLLCQN